MCTLNNIIIIIMKCAMRLNDHSSVLRFLEWRIQKLIAKCTFLLVYPPPPQKKIYK